MSEQPAEESSEQRYFGQSGGPEVGVKTFRFGDFVMEGDNGPMVADDGDVVVFVTNGSQIMAATLDPDGALKLAEEIMTAALLGRDIIAGPSPS